MKKINRTMFFSVLVVLAYVLSACSGAPAGQSSNDQQAQSGQAQDVVFSGTVESVNGNQWVVSGQTITVEGGTTGIAVGDNVKVEAHVAEDGTVTAVHIEVAGADNANSNSSNGNDSNINDSNANGNDNTSNSNDNQGGNSNSSNGNGNANDNSSAANDQEVSGVVEAVTTQSITINGVVYMIADFTQFKTLIAMGDKVKLHVIVNADGTLTIREIEKSAQTGLDNGNSNSNGNGSDDNSNSNTNSSSNSNSDDKGGNTNGGSSNDNGGGGNDNGGGGNDNGGGGNDNGGGGNGNGNG